MEWVVLERPGQSGTNKASLEKRWDGLYGQGNWKKAWQYDNGIIDRIAAYHLCEEAYFADSFRRPDAWKRLIIEAADVYDASPSEIQSGLDYSKQSDYSRYHDIAIRRVVSRRCWRFSGESIVQIRWNKDKPDWYSENFDPGKVTFHMPGLIILPHISGWWDAGSIEDFYQSNKVLLARKG
jgi:hypothetical protein